MRALKTHWTFKTADLQFTKRPNVNTFEGAKFFLDTYYSAPAPYTAVWYCGLVLAGDADVTDTAARITTTTPNPPTTNGWQEYINYSGDRQLIPWVVNDDGTVDNVAAPLFFTPALTGHIIGGFISTVAAKGSTAGKLYTVQATPGSPIPVQAGIPLQVTISTAFFHSPV